MKCRKLQTYTLLIMIVFIDDSFGNVGLSFMTSHAKQISLVLLQKEAIRIYFCYAYGNRTILYDIKEASFQQSYKEKKEREHDCFLKRPLAKTMIRNYFVKISQSGKLIVTNKHRTNPSNHINVSRTWPGSSDWSSKHDVFLIASSWTSIPYTHPLNESSITSLTNAKVSLPLPHVASTTVSPFWTTSFHTLYWNDALAYGNCRELLLSQYCFLYHIKE